MLKLTILAIIIAAAHAGLTGGFVPQPVVTAEALEVANWAASNLAGSLGQTHSVVAIRNLRTQVVAGVNYRFTLELLVDNQVSKSCEMDIFEQKWNNIRKFNVEPVCTVATSMGGYKPTPINDEVMSLARWAAATFTQGVHTVVAVSNYRTQLVAGVNHKFTLELLVDGKVSKTCEMSIFTQSWTNTIKNFEEPICKAAARSFGGFQPSHVTDKVKELASWSARTMSTVGAVHNVAEIKNVQKQVVNGVNYKFDLTLTVNGQSKTCKMSVYDQEWTGVREFFAEPVCSVSRAGQFVDSEVTDQVKEIASWCARSMSNGEEVHSVVEIQKVQTQIVAGINYKFTLVLSVNDKITKSCEMNVFDQVWTGVRKFNEEPKCSAVALIGGYVPQTEVSEEALEVAKWASSELAARANAMLGSNPKFPILHSVKTVKNLRTQVVAGINYKFTLELMVSQPPSNAIWTKSCDLAINVQPWNNLKTFIEEPKC